MQTSFYPALIFCLGLTSHPTVHAEIINEEAAIEAVEFGLTHARVGGFIQARQCKNCPQLNLQIDDKTKVFASGKELPVSSIPTHPKFAITVIYDPGSKIAKRVIW